MLTQKENFDKVLLKDMATAHKKESRVMWYYAPVFLLFWFVLFFAIVLPVFLKLPEGLTVENEQQHPGEFIAERAQRILYDFDMIGPKVTGSYANENITLQLLHNELDKIRGVMRHDLFDLEVDVQVVSGTYIRGSMVNAYHSVQNFVVKLSSKNSTSQNYLLINSHFDSKPGSPGAGDDGAMVVVMLETLRVLATNRETFKHPIVFLFNGAEENSLQGSHGFITQHKWAKNCKALINLDSAGSGNREILFQSGPNHPWLIKYYSKYAVRPFASTVAEELFESKIIPSDTDFRIFRDYGNVPGLDFAHFYNGYVYHTKYDRYDIIPRGTLQATGDNILSLAKAFANATEMEDTEKYSKGHSVFYDFFGILFVRYTESEAKIINISMSLIVFIGVGTSIWRMAAISYISIGRILQTYFLILILHLAGIVLAVGLPVLVAFVYDSANHSMTWFASKWLVFGLYVCPALFGLALPTVLYLSSHRNDKLKRIFKIQLIQHAHGVLLAVMCIVTTFKGFRSSYIILIPLFFYGVALIVNLIPTLYRRNNFWCIFLILSQILPFLYITYIFLILLSALMPMMGRSGCARNPDLVISVACAVATVLSMGFVLPMWNLFRRSKILLSCLLLVTLIFAMLALTPIGFPYRPNTNVGRIDYLNVRRIFYEYNGSVSLNESGYYFNIQDRRLHQLQDVNIRNRKNLSNDCNKYMMCGLPLFNHQMVHAVEGGIWLPSREPTELPGTPKLKILKTYFTGYNTSRYEFELSGPQHMSIFLQPLEGVQILNWSFLKLLLQESKIYKPPYHIYITYGKQLAPLKFYLDIELTNKTFEEPKFKLGISGHYVSTEYPRGKHAQEFVKKFPDYVFVKEWPSSYERYIF